MYDPYMLKIAKEINNEKIEEAEGKFSLRELFGAVKEIKEELKKEGIVKFGVDEDMHKSWDEWDNSTTNPISPFYLD